MRGFDRNRCNLLYREGYIKALEDLAYWVNQPNKPFSRSLCTSKRLQKVIQFIAENADCFAEAPDVFDLNFEIGKKDKLRLWLGN